MAPDHHTLVENEDNFGDTTNDDNMTITLVENKDSFDDRINDDSMTQRSGRDRRFVTDFGEGSHKKVTLILIPRYISLQPTKRKAKEQKCVCEL